MLNLKEQKIVRGIAYTFEVLFVVIFIILCVAIGIKNKTIKTEKAQIKALTTQVDSLTRINQALGAETVYTVNCIINLTSKNIMGVNTINSNNIAKTVATTTRQELLDLRDSLNKPKQ